MQRRDAVRQGGIRSITFRIARLATDPGNKDIRVSFFGGRDDPVERIDHAVDRPERCHLSRKQGPRAGPLLSEEPPGSVVIDQPLEVDLGILRTCGQQGASEGAL